MKICGIIAEYNPFHSGHAHHIRETKKLLGENTAIVCVMSGNYVQRGDAAIMEKYQRARAAARCGADLVLEMPLSAALSSAAGFAWGGVELLHKLGCVDHLSFGSECGDLALLTETAHLLKSEQLSEHLKTALRSGLSYAAAQQKALEALSPKHAKLLETANNTLGIEYLCALHALDSSIRPVTVKREGALHDAAQLEKNEHPSASALRNMIFEGRSGDCLPYLPAESAEELYTALNAGAAPASLQNNSAMLLAHLRRFGQAEIIRYTGGDEGLASRLHQAIRTQNTFHAVCTDAQTRCYPVARIRRILVRMFLDLAPSVAPEVHYARVLAIGPHGREMLRAAEASGLPLIVKPSSEKRLPEALRPLLRQDELADDLYALLQPDSALHIAGARYRKTPYVSPKVLLDFPSV